MKIIIVPGGQIVATDKVGPLLLIRCEKALEIFQTGNYEYILTTGGLTHSKAVQTLPEAEITKKWLISRGVPPEKIILEIESVDSFGHIQNGLSALERNGVRLEEIEEIAVPSQWQNLIRYWITLKLGYKIRSRIKLVKLYPKISLQASFIEWGFIGYHFIDPKGKGFLVKKYRQSIINKRRQS